MKTWLVTLGLTLALFPASGAVGYSSEPFGERRDADKGAYANAWSPESEAGSKVTFDSTATLEDYVAVATGRNPALRGAYEEWIAALRNSEHVGALPEPMLSYGYFAQNVETRVGPQEQRLSLKQELPWFGTLGAKRDMATNASKAAFKKFEAERLKLLYQVKVAYYDYFFIGQDLAITRENLELLKFWESVVRSKYSVGLKRHPDVIKAQVELGRLEDRLRTVQEETGPAAARLRALLNLKEDVTMPIPAAIDTNEAELQEEAVVDRVKMNNPGLQALSYLVEREEAAVRLANRLSLPSFSLGVDYIQTGEALNPGMPESGKDAWIVGASISLPIWFGKNGARRNEARARREAAQYAASDAENQLVAATTRILFEYSDALRKTRLYRDGLVPKAQQALNASFVAYQSGEVDFLNVLDAQRQLLEFQLTVAREKVRLSTKLAHLETLIGSELDDTLFRQP